MKSIFVLLLLSNLVVAALPPQVQKAKKLDVMTSFVEIHYGDGCIAKFGRKFSFHLPGWVGPASALEFKDSTCPVQ